MFSFRRPCVCIVPLSSVFYMLVIVLRFYSQVSMLKVMSSWSVIFPGQAALLVNGQKLFEQTFVRRF